METIIGLAAKAEWEYVCADCKQFRLYLKDKNVPSTCGNCGSKNIYIAPYMSISILKESEIIYDKI